MKKIFTLIAVAALALGANAQKITFDGESVSDGKVFEKDGLKITITDTDGKFAIDANNAWFGDATAQEKFTARLKSGGKSSSKNNIKVTVPGAGALNIYPRSASSSATDRNMVVTQNGSELYNKVVQDNDAAVIVIEANISDTNPTGETKVYPIISLTVAAGDVEITYPAGAMNFYCFEFVAGGTGDDTGGQGGGSEQGGGQEQGGGSAAAIDFPTSKAGITISGTTTWDNSQKYHNNNDATSNISFANGYTTEGVINENWAELAVDGGFLAGDVVSVAGYFNNNDETKQSAVTLFVGAKGEAPTDLWTSGLFINGRTNAADPTVESYTLEAAYPTLKLGRANGLTSATRTNVTLLKVVRGGSTGIAEQLNLNVNVNAPVYNLAGQQVDKSFKGVVIQNGKKLIQK